MSLQVRLGDLITAIGTDIKSLRTRVTTLENKPVTVIDGGMTPGEAAGTPPLIDGGMTPTSPYDGSTN